MTVGTVSLLHPHWLWLLPILALLIIAGRRWGAPHRQPTLANAAASSAHILAHPLARLIPQTQARAYTLGGSWLYALAFGCLVLALCQPVRIGAQLPDPPRQRDLVFIIDISESMSEQDYALDGQPISRMAILKGLLDHFVQGLPGERFSFIVFADRAYTLLPLTRDGELARHVLRRVQTGLAGSGNAIGEAIALAVKQAGDAPERERILVLMTDAALPTGAIEPAAAAALAAEARIPLYTVAIGSEAGASDAAIHHGADLALMQHIAQQTGGTGYVASDTTAIERALADISSRGTNEDAQAPRHLHHPLYLWPLGLGLALLTLAQIVRQWRKAS